MPLSPGETIAEFTTAVGAVSEPRGALLGGGRAFGVKVLLHAWWASYLPPAPHQPIAGPAHLARLAGGLEAGDIVVDGAGAERGTRLVRVPTLPQPVGRGHQRSR